MKNNLFLKTVILIGSFNVLSTQLFFGQEFNNLNRLYSEFYKSFNNNEDYIATIKGDSLLSEIKSLHFATDTTVINIQLDLAYAHFIVGNYNNALNLCISSKEFFETKWDISNSKYDILLNLMAQCYESKGDYLSALDYFDLILKINEKKYGFYHQYSLSAFTHIAGAYDHLGYYNDAIYFHDRAIEIALKLYGENHKETLNCFSNKALNLRKANDFNGALKLNNKVLSLRKKKLGQNHPDYLLSLCNIAELQGELGLFEDARHNFKICIESYENQFGVGNVDYINYLSNYAVFLEKAGIIDTALIINKRCLQLFNEIQGSNVLDYIRYLNNLGTTYLSSGNPAFAKIYIDSALQLSEINYGVEHPTSIQLLENLASCFGQLGNYNTAITLQEKCLDRIRIINTTSSLEYASGLNQFAYFNSKLGLDSLSLKSNIRAYEIRKAILGKDHPLTVLSLFNLSVDYSNLNMKKLALDANFDILKHYITTYGEKHQFTKDLYNNIGLCYSRLEDYSNALNFYLKSIEENNNPAIQINISNLYEKMGQISKAIEYQETAVYWYLDDYYNNQLYLSDTEKAKYKQNLDYYVTYLVYLNYQNGLSSNTPKWYDSYISISHLINNNLNSNIGFKNIEDKEQFVKIVNELKSLRRRKNKLIELNNKEDLPTINNRIEKLEAQYSAIVGNPTKRLLSAEMICNKLIKENECFVDIVPFTKFSDNSNAYLGVITQREGTSVVVLDTLGIIQSQVLSSYNQETSNKDKIGDLKWVGYYNYLWKPIASKIGGAKVVYVSLGGAYNKFNLNTIFNPETGKYLLEEYDIRIVNSARDFVFNKESVKKEYSTNTACLFGFPNFDGNSSISGGTDEVYAFNRDLSTFWIDSLTRGGMKVSSLPETKVEVQNISKTMTSINWNVRSYLGDSADEANLKSLKCPRVLHIATHGYFFADIPYSSENNRFLGMNREQVIQDPMLRSGLLFTGANNTLKGESSKGENGLLSAAEASLLDLRETELVVLSACETGRGEETNSEGVYGLRKAFADAGAQNIIMSLWKVDDKVTQEFMSRFYEIWLIDKTTIREAFNRTQLEIKAKYPEPYYWGAFILIGV